MKEAVAPAQYLQIALDIAGRIAAGNLPEGSRVYGRSVMSSEYAVSPETIRRALRLLADMKVVEIKPQSGVTVLSADSARRYVKNFSEAADAWALREQLRDLLDQYAELNRRTMETATALMKSRGASSELRGSDSGELSGSRQEYRGTEILAVHRRNHCGNPPRPFRHFVSRPLCGAL